MKEADKAYWFTTFVNARLASSVLLDPEWSELTPEQQAELLLVFQVSTLQEARKKYQVKMMSLAKGLGIVDRFD